MTFSISIGGHAANPDEERAIADYVATLLASIQTEHEVTVHAATFHGQYGSRDFLSEAAPEGTVAGVEQDERFQPPTQEGDAV